MLRLFSYAKMYRTISTRTCNV